MLYQTENNYKYIQILREYLKLIKYFIGDNLNRLGLLLDSEKNFLSMIFSCNIKIEIFLF